MRSVSTIWPSIPPIERSRKRAIIDAQTRSAFEGSSPWFFWAFVAYLLFAPLYKAGNRPFPLLVLELGAVGFLFIVFALPKPLPSLPRSLAWALAIAVMYPLVQLIPLPEWLWRALPGHGEYVSAMDRFGASAIAAGLAHPTHTLSMVPYWTEQGWLATLPPLACLFCTLRLRSTQLLQLLIIMPAFAAAEAILGLLQAGVGSSAAVYRAPETINFPGRTFGTFVDPNHFAAFLALNLVLIVGWLAYLRHPESALHREPVDGHDQREARIFGQRSLLLAAALMLLLCLILTWSRAGIATALVGLVAISLLLAHSRGGMRLAWILVLGVAGMAAILAVLVGISPFVHRFDPGQLAENMQSRWLMTTTTLRAAIEFLPFGSGLSTLEDVFPRFQTGALSGDIDYAHNDYAQLLMEVGLAAPVMVGLAFFAYFRRMSELLRGNEFGGLASLQMTAGIALLPLILHSAFEFGLHIPSIAMWFATLVGILFHRGTVVTTPMTPEHKTRSARSADARLPPSSDNRLHGLKGPRMNRDRLCIRRPVYHGDGLLFSGGRVSLVGLWQRNRVGGCPIAWQANFDGSDLKQMRLR